MSDRIPSPFEEYQIAVMECEACPLQIKCRAPVPGSGKIDTNIMIIGEAPGETEDKEGVPFIGASGELLRETIKRLFRQVDHNFFITNTVKCRPTENRTPTQRECDLCASIWIQREFELIEPKAVILLGRVAHHTILPYTTDLNNGQNITINGVEYVYFHHPSYWLRNGGRTYAREQVSPALEKIHF